MSAPNAPITSATSCIQLGIIPILMADKSVSKITCTFNIATIGPAALPVAKAAVANNDPHPLPRLPMKPIKNNLHENKSGLALKTKTLANNEHTDITK